MARGGALNAPGQLGARVILASSSASMFRSSSTLWGPIGFSADSDRHADYDFAVRMPKANSRKRSRVFYLTPKLPQQNVRVPRNRGVLGLQSLDPAHGMQDRGVIATTKATANIG